MHSLLKILISAGFVIAGLMSPDCGMASFGKNKVQYRYFQWEYLTTEHFDVYFNQDGREIANFAVEVAEDAYRDMADRFNYSGSGEEPITLITYQSHNDFEQTNVTSDSPEESVGGFTEFLRTRVVVPFEGDHERFRHVIHHELTHAMTLNLLYGQGFGAVLSGVSQTRVPLWFMEGLAEYHSRGGLDSETEMYLRDAVVNDMLPEIRNFNEYGYLGVYKCGQSVVYYIAWRYGDEKIGEILHHLKGLRDFDRALKAAIGMDEEELSKRWRRFLKERYWEQAAKLDSPTANAAQITDHKKEFCYINNSPALSPNGEYLAFLSDRSDFFDVYLMRTFDGKVIRKLVHGQRTGQFEELHWLRPGITWSPDGKQIALAAKAGANDAVFIISVDDGKIVRKIVRESDGIFSPSWSPDGSKISFIYVQNGSSDLALYDLTTNSFELLTDDIFDDADPSWSPDSRSIIFTSNRGGLQEEAELPDGRTMKGHNIASFDAFQLELDSRLISRLTHLNKIVRTPIWTPQPGVFIFVGNQNGIFNLYSHNLATGESTPLSNVATGFLQPSLAWKTHALAFTSYFDQGYDIYLVNDIDKLKPLKNIYSLSEAETVTGTNRRENGFGEVSSDYSEFVFDRLLTDFETIEKEKVDSSEIVSRTRVENGEYPVHDYEMKLTPDYVTFSASYNPYYRMQGSGMILFSDVLGNHDLYLAADFNRDTENSNFFVQYDYLARRFDLGVGFFHFAYPYYTTNAKKRDRNFGFFITSSYPLNRYNRIEFGSDYMVVERADIEALPGHEEETIQRSTVIPHLGYVHDTSIWKRSTAPSNGSRWRIDMSWSPNIREPGEGFSFTTFGADWRKYIAFRNEYSFGIRFSGGVSYGADPQRFFLGGVQNWFNPRYDNDQRSVQIDDLKDVYYSTFVGPLRGVGFYNQVGSRYMLSNTEFRFPFIKHLVFGWPLPIYIRDLQGALFTDWGAAWYPERQFKDGLLPAKGAFGFGFGLRLDLGIFPIEWDIAWSPDKRSNMIPQYYFSINTGF